MFNSKKIEKLNKDIDILEKRVRELEYLCLGVTNVYYDVCCFKEQRLTPNILDRVLAIQRFLDIVIEQNKEKKQAKFIAKKAPA